MGILVLRTFVTPKLNSFRSALSRMRYGVSRIAKSDAAGGKREKPLAGAAASGLRIRPDSEAHHVHL